MNRKTEIWFRVSMKPLLVYVGSCILVAVLFAQPVLADDFFGDQLSEREEYSRNSATEDITGTIEAIDMMQRIMMYQAFQDGRCEEYFEIETKAKNGDAVSQWILGDLYFRGLCVTKDDSRALEWTLKAANSGHADAYFDVGVFLKDGIGGNKNPKAAIGWLEKATEYNINAYRMLALIYLSGEGVPANYNKSLEYAHKGASYGDPNAQFLTALMLAQDGFDYSDSVQAYKWALLAKASGSENLVTPLSELMGNLESGLRVDQLVDAQELAAGWKSQELVQSKSLDPTDIDLPNVSFESIEDLTLGQANSLMQELGLERDRFLFFKAINEDNLGVTALYIRAGASVEVFSPTLFYTPLICAAVEGSEKVAKFLLEEGADINRSLNHDNDTPVLYALSRGNRGIADMLIEGGAKLDHPGIMYNAVEFDDPILLADLNSRGVPIDEEFVGTPLSHSVAVTGDDGEQYCKAASAEYLINNGASLEARDSLDRTLVQSALNAQNPYACVKVLLDHGATLDASIGEEPIFAAILAGNADVVRLLLEHGSDPNLKYSLEASQVPMILGEQSKDIVMNGGSLLHLAVEEQHAAIARHLVSYGADVNAKDNKGKTPLSVATENEDSLMVAVLEKKI